jgi:cytochrome c-type biogenesis protein CcmH
VPVLAQSNTVTDDDVRDVAEGMYCPICENEPLDDCRNVTCLQWKAEIRRMLGEGMSEDAIVDDFIARYGDQVVGVPPSPFLRALSLGLPVLIFIGALLVGWMTFSRWRGPAKTEEPSDITPESTTEDDAYRQMLERDLG